MKKFILMSFASMAFAPAAFSHEGHAHHADKPRPFTGLQVMMGVGGIIAGLETTQEAESVVSTVDFFFGTTYELSDDITNDANLFQSNIAGQLSLGYTYQFANGFVLGAFASVGATNIEFEDTVEENGRNVESSTGFDGSTFIFSENTNARLETTHDYDIALLMKPGFLIGKRTWLYGMLGPRWGHFNSSYHLSTDASTSLGGDNEGGLPTFLSAAATDHASQYAVGFTAGVGFAQLLTKHLMLGLEYAYTAYGEIDALDASDTNTLICINEDGEGLGCIESSVTGSATIEPNINTVMATLSYKF